MIIYIIILIIIVLGLCFAAAFPLYTQVLCMLSRGLSVRTLPVVLDPSSVILIIL